jgi:hypothetical protein
MKVGKLAEDWVWDYYRKRGKVLTKARKGDVGYDFRSGDGKLFVEVKGTANSTLANTGFRYFTNTQYERARQCLRDKTRYEIHLIVGVCSDAIKH